MPGSIFKCIFTYFVCMWMRMCMCACLYACAPNVCRSPFRSQEALDLLALVLEVAVSQDVDAEKQT